MRAEGELPRRGKRGWPGPSAPTIFTGSGETLACGTGACAAVVAACENGLCDKGSDVKVSLLGGELTVNYTDGRVLLTGGASIVFEGSFEY